MEQKSVLIVEDDGIVALHLSHMLTDLGYSVLSPVARGETAIALAAAERPDLILMDIQLAGEMDGITTAGHIRASVDVPVVFLTSFANSPLLKRASAVSPYGYLLKPESPQVLAATIEMAFHKHTLDQQLKEHKEALQKANDELERRVAARTEALQRANEELQSEIIARRRTEETLQVLSSRLLVSQEEEQRRIAMELHDQTGQDLSVLKLQMASLRSRLRKDQASLKDDFKKALTFIDGVMEDVRRLAHGLSPSQLQILGLCAALQAMIRNFSEKTRISVQFCVDALDNIFPGDTEIVLYRIFQEALTNIYKHSGAKSVNIDTSRKGDALRIQIRDNGRGFDTHRYLVSGPIDNERGMGLSAIQLRARMIGGDLKISSQPGKGTEITLFVPVNPIGAEGRIKMTPVFRKVLDEAKG